MADQKRMQASCSIRKRKWTPQEDRSLQAKVRMMHNGELPSTSEIHWSKMKTLLPHRTPLQLRERYVHVLNPAVDRRRVTTRETLKVLEFHKKYGKKWSKIAAHMPGRTSLLVKNAFYSAFRRFKRHYSRPPSGTDELIEYYWQFVVNEDVNFKVNEEEPLTSLSDPVQQRSNSPESRPECSSVTGRTDDELALSDRSITRLLDSLDYPECIPPSHFEGGNEYEEASGTSLFASLYGVSDSLISWEELPLPLTNDQWEINHSINSMLTESEYI